MNRRLHIIIDRDLITRLEDLNPNVPLSNIITALIKSSVESGKPAVTRRIVDIVPLLAQDESR